MEELEGATKPFVHETVEETKKSEEEILDEHPEVQELKKSALLFSTIRAFVWKCVFLWAWTAGKNFGFAGEWWASWMHTRRTLQSI